MQYLYLFIVACLVTQCRVAGGTSQQTPHRRSPLRAPERFNARRPSGNNKHGIALLIRDRAIFLGQSIQTVMMALLCVGQWEWRLVSEKQNSGRGGSLRRKVNVTSAE
jgi:hypothetical protein